MKKLRILWTDDEIENLRPHIYFLLERGYEVETCSNGNDAVELIKKNAYDLLLLDEHMPGLSGIETLKLIKEIRPEIPVVMVTKSEEETLMDAAIGSEIADFLIKPVKPNQVLLVLKKNLEQKRLVTEKTTTDYTQEFIKISSMISSASTPNDWIDIYRKIVYWEIELDRLADTSLYDILQNQEYDANNSFCRFVTKNYLSWLTPGNPDRPLMSHQLMQKTVFPLLSISEPLFFILIDNMRLDQWKTLQSELSGLYRITDESAYFSILPTSTQFSRNAIFSGLMPLSIEKTMPGMWTPDFIENEGKNEFEDEFLRRQVARYIPEIKWSYNKVNNGQEGKKLNERLESLLKNNLNVIVYNFVDILSHARTEMNLIRDLAADERAFRSLTKSWFIHSSLFELLKAIASVKVKVVITTDHGSIRVSNPLKVVGDRESSPSLRYKTGRSLDYDPGKVFEIKNPEKALLPATNLTSRYIFALNRDYLVYHNNFNYFASYYKDTFQHGGISMQEMILPLVFLEPVL
ncbi:MAG TPA: bifunctional response regulator/alkaline phosphatase family protein [Bacteroidales bacterium]|nr:bifunctional response regulator/alkaline phosphatase family protein [Bacteroidales bacterium]HQG37043.1 bifunctional response regulator/alkaline phosphatase family protein [Bacteroidales bacterium]HQG53562.1 bifunctional response regulator/alkaline phosphatase family protein [Bacteroidales bacterium]HQJ21183.1 bifunctional response regulator/alkaline phosphatase family protein [Bacteroidales bacterium]